MHTNIVVALGLYLKFSSWTRFRIFFFFWSWFKEPTQEDPRRSDPLPQFILATFLGFRFSNRTNLKKIKSAYHTSWFLHYSTSSRVNQKRSRRKPALSLMKASSGPRPPLSLSIFPTIVSWIFVLIFWSPFILRIFRRHAIGTLPRCFFAIHDLVLTFKYLFRNNFVLDNNLIWRHQVEQDFGLHWKGMVDSTGNLLN